MNKCILLVLNKTVHSVDSSTGRPRLRFEPQPRGIRLFRGPLPRKSSHLGVGQFGEDAACGYLERCGYRILTRAWRCPLGQIDIIAQVGDTLVFVEVKTRSSDTFGQAAETLRDGQRCRIRRAAELYVSTQIGPGGNALALRFDLLLVSAGQTQPAEHLPVEHLENI